MAPRTKAPDDSARALGLADLARSGLDATDAKALGVEFWSAAETGRRFPRSPVPALLLPYFDAEGVVRSDVYRVRFLAPPPLPFGAVPEKWQRYGQPPGSAPGAYLPRLPDLDWQILRQDPTANLLITEGEKKAACAGKLKLPTIGLGGVWSFMSKAKGLDLLPELAAFKWRERAVTIVYDSDVATKPDVAAAIVQLMRVLTRRGALVSVALLPELSPGQKCGLDDYLVARGAERFEGEVLAEAKAGDLGRRLWELNERFAVIAHPTMVLDERGEDYAGRPAQVLMRATDFNLLLRNQRVVEAVVDAGGAPRLKPVSVADAWLEWPARREYGAVTYLPGQPRVVGKSLNGWQGLAVEPVKGGVEPWTELLDHLFTGADPKARTWFERWCGYPLWRLGTKLMSAAAMWSKFQGVGKTLVGETLGLIYGANYISVPQKDLESDFNGWAANRQFVLVDDIPAHEQRQRADLLKKLITQSEIHLNPKFVPQYSMPDFINYYFTSNQPNAFYLEPHDRRLFIHEVTIAKLPTEFYDEFHAWLKGGGPSALLYYFQHDLDFGDFDPKHAPPATEAKAQMAEDAASEVDAWLTALVACDLGGRDLWGAAELAEKFNAAAVGRRVAPNALARDLRLRFYRVGPVRVGREVVKLFAVRNGDRWAREAARGAERLAKAVAEHLQSAKRF